MIVASGSGGEASGGGGMNAAIFTLSYCPGDEDAGR